MIACGHVAHMNARAKSRQASPLQRGLADIRRPNRVYLRYGLTFRRWLLPTPPRGDAVTFGYRRWTFHLKKTCTSLTSHTLNRTLRCLRLRFHQKVPFMTAKSLRVANFLWDIVCRGLPERQQWGEANYFYYNRCPQ